jgi:inorganic pyrophosphatase
MILHPWHLLSPGKGVPKTVNTVIEITKGSKAKYELDKETGLLRLDRVLLTHLTYPFHYGFIPQTYGDDDDPLDAVIICSEPLVPLTIVEATPIGALHMIDGGQQDDKIIAVATHDHAVNSIKTLEELPADLLNTIKEFFETYKKLEEKQVVVERFLDKNEAYLLIERCIDQYKEKLEEGYFKNGL